MASNVTVQKIGARFSFESIPHVPGSAAATFLTPDGTTQKWRDMRDYEWFGVSAANAVLTGNGLTQLDIWAASDTAGTNATLVASVTGLTGTAVGNGAFLECVASQIREVEAAASLAKFTLRYLTAKITVANSADKLAVALLRGMAKREQLNLTPATF